MIRALHIFAGIDSISKELFLYPMTEAVSSNDSSRLPGTIPKFKMRRVESQVIRSSFFLSVSFYMLDSSR